MATATVSIDSITVAFSADMVKNDYGVPGSPVWDEATNITVESLEMLGVEVDIKTLPPALQSAILDLAAEVEDWE
jgi:hypothetical protein